MTFGLFIQAINFFIIYAFLGWVVEVIYHAVAQGVIVNRGFLNGPICPIYGFGMLLILYLLLPISDNLLILFIGGMILTTAIELFGGWALEKLFHLRWWDYSNEPFNLHGYICVKFSLAWGLGVVGAVRIIHSIVGNISDFVFRTPLKWLLIPVGILFVIDIVATVLTILHFQKELRRLDRIAKDMRDFSDSMTEVIGGKAHEIDVRIDEGRVQAALGKAEMRQKREERKKTIDRNLAASRQLTEIEIEQRRKTIEKIHKRLHQNRLYGYGRIMEAFPGAVLVRKNMRLTDFVEQRRLGGHDDGTH